MLKSSGAERTLDAVERIRIVRVDRPEAGASGLSTLPIRRDSTRPGFWILEEAIDSETISILLTFPPCY